MDFQKDFILSETGMHLPEPSPKEKIDMALRHLEMLTEQIENILLFEKSERYRMVSKGMHMQQRLERGQYFSD